MKYLIIAVVSMLTGCQTLETVKVVKEIGCVVITEESRAEIRSKQKLQTNICKDDL